MRFAASIITATFAAGFSSNLLATPAWAQNVNRVERGNLITENVPATPQSIKDRIRQYLNTRGASFAGWSYDGKSMLITTRFGETAQIHRVDAPMGMRRQLTFNDEPTIGNYRPGPGPRTIVYSKDKGGDEYFQLYLLDESTGQATMFTDGVSRNFGVTYSDDGQLVSWASVGRNSDKYKIWIANGMAPKEPSLLFEEAGAWNPVAFSKDKSKLLITRDVSVNESYLYVVDLKTKQRTQVNPTDKKIAYNFGAFSADGKSVITISDEDSDFARLVRIDLTTNAKTVLSGDIKWDVESFTVSEDGKTIAYSINEAGASKLKFITSGGQALPGPTLPLGTASQLSFTRDGTRFGFSLSTAKSPDDVWVWDLKAKTLTPWTDSETGGLSKSSFVEPSLISYKSFDGRDITAFLYKPRGAGPHPVLLYPHGGPEGQTRPNFAGFFQFLANEMGIATIAPNVRGSTGYGRAFVNLDNGKLREDSVKDMGALIQWIDTQRDLDGKRLAVYGGSYGGYMSYATMTTYDDRMSAGIAAVGISNFVTFLENTSEYRRDLRRVEYGDERDTDMRKFQIAISPMTNVAKIKKPMFIIQGFNDPRVPMSEAEQMLKAIRANGADAWYMLAKDEGHGFAKKANRDAQNEAIAAFLSSKLLGRPMN